MDLFFNIVYFIGAIAILILIHEIGHFLAARFFGVEVEEFGIGFPPKALTLFTLKGTEYTLNWIPLGGFVRPKGENDPTVPGGLAAAKPMVRVAVLLAGPMMNFLAGALIFTGVTLLSGMPVEDKVKVFSVEPGTPAASAGFEAEDIFVSANGILITDSDTIINIIHSNLGSEILLEVDRAGDIIQLSLTPRTEWPPDQGPSGISLGSLRAPVPLGLAIQSGFYGVYDYARLLISIPSQIITGKISPEEGRLVGYTGMYRIYDEMREQDSEYTSNKSIGVNTLIFFGTITTSLGLLNLMPFPALDGGRILFTLPELLFGKRIPQNLENVVNLAGFLFLIGLMIYVNLQDILNPISLP